MKLTMLSKITLTQREHMESLIHLCCSAEPIHLSIPLPEADKPLSDERFFVLYDCDRLISLIHLFYPDQEIGELIGFTHPDYRGQGYFRALLDMAADYADRIGLHQVYLISDGNSADAIHALKHLGLKAEYTEYMLKKALPAQSLPEQGFPKSLAFGDGLSLAEVSASDMTVDIFSRIFNVGTDESLSYLGEIASDERIRTFLFMKGNLLLGQTQITMMDGLAYLSGFGILPEYRRQGLGLYFLHRLEQTLVSEALTTLTLQVSSKNKPALSLYRKDGFEPLEALHYSPLFEEG